MIKKYFLSIFIIYTIGLFGAAASNQVEGNIRFKTPEEIEEMSLETQKTITPLMESIADKNNPQKFKKLLNPAKRIWCY